MAGKRKISITEALQALKDHKLKVVVEPISQHYQPVEQENQVVRKIGNTTTTIRLNYQHTVGSGGTLFANKDGKKDIVENEGRVYGPGVVSVSNEMAKHLLYQEQMMKQQNERFYETTPRSYLIVKRASAVGGFVNVGVQVQNSVFDNFGVHLDQTMVI